jgi:hypothetical protein
MVMSLPVQAQRGFIQLARAHTAKVIDIGLEM